MKLQHLPIGARFEFEGEIFVKTGPLTASSESSGQRVIPRYAVLRPLDPPPEAGHSAASNRPTVAAVRAAYAAAEAVLREALGESAESALAQARRRFFNGLGVAAD